MYDALMKTGTLPGLRDTATTSVGPPAQVGIFDAWKLAAAAVGTAAGKEVPITVDTVEYYNRVIGFPESDDYASPWGVSFIRSTNPDDAGTAMTTGERFVDYSGFHYNRSETYTGSVTWLNVPTLTWKVSRIADVVHFTNLTSEPIGDRTLHGVTAFAQLADDVRAVILYYHDHETIPGFYIDPVGVDTTVAQEKAIHDPAVGLTVPAYAFQNEPFSLTARMFNPFGGVALDGLRLRVTIDAATDLTTGDITARSGADLLDLQAVDGNLVGWWGPETGSSLAPGSEVSTDFQVEATDGAVPGPYDVKLELVDVDSVPGTVLAEDAGTVDVKDDVATVLWADEVYPLVTQGTPFQVPVTVYSPTAGEADLTFALAGPGDDAATDLVEALKDGDATAYASDGSDMVKMPLSLDDQGRLVGSWHLPLVAGLNPVTWYVTIAEGALVGGYTLDVGLTGGNSVEPAALSVAAPESHGEKPPDAGEDTTAPVVTISVVGTLSADASFTLAADEPAVTYKVRLVKDDVPGEWVSAPDASVVYTDLVPGMYSFQVKATDAAGNVSPMYAKSWVVAPEPGDPVPNTTVASGPAKDAWVLSHRTAFDLVSSIPGSAYIVTLNGRYLGTSSTDRVVVPGLTTGRNVITIGAITGGYADQTPVVRRIWVPRGVARIAHSSAWVLRHEPGHLFGTYAQSRRHGQTFTMRSSAIKRIALVVSTRNGYGKFRVLLNGRPIGDAISLSTSTSAGRTLVPVRTFGATKHGTITVKVVSATGKIVRLEGIAVAAH